MNGPEHAPPPQTARLVALIRPMAAQAPGLFDIGALLFIASVAWGVSQLSAEWRAPQGSTVEIDLRLSALPLYTFFSLCRGLAAFAASFAFTLIYGYAAARVRNADKVLLPLLDVLQSIPVLSFMPGLVLGLAALFPRNNVGLELAAILSIFTGQVWNMTFSFHASLRSIPPELMEAGRVYRFGWWRRFTRIELPFSTVPLIWNGMMSMAGGWFFLTINEAFRLGDRDFRLPGVGAYMSVAIDRDDHAAMAGAVFAMVAMIVLLDQLFWRPLVAWAEKFKVQELGGDKAESWLLTLLQQSRLSALLRAARKQAKVTARLVAGRTGSATLAECAPPRVPVLSRGRADLLGLLLVLVPLGLLTLWGAGKLIALLALLHAGDWIGLFRAAGLTFLRTTAAVALGTLWTVPAGIYIGTHPRASRVLQPLVQVAASFPAPMLFPLVLLVLARLHVGLGLGSIALMMLGTQWYILFNVTAGAMGIPAELKEAATVYRFGKWRTWTRVLLPGVFPQLVTGWVTAAGGAWNASIVSEYIHAGGEVKVTEGLGASISRATELSQFPMLAAATLLMAVLVVGINRVFWHRLYALAERKYSL
jgi:NitT/TauT family transport system permease protein